MDSSSQDGEESDEWTNYYRKGLISKLDDKIYLTDFHGACNHEKLKEIGITRVISLGDMDEHEIYKKCDEFEYLSLVLDDTEYDDISIYFEKCNEFIVKSEGPILVHCWAGISRSVSIVIAHFILSKKMSYLQSFFFIKTIRPFISHNSGFMEALCKLQNRKLEELF